MISALIRHEHIVISDVRNRFRQSTGSGSDSVQGVKLFGRGHSVDVLQFALTVELRDDRVDVAILGLKVH
jgi:hypothetical protein